MLSNNSPRTSSEPVQNNVIQLLVALLQIYSFVLLARIVLSWIPNVDRSNQIVQLLYQLTEPVLEPVRRTIPPLGMIDLSPIIVFIGLRILQSVLTGMASD
jgi:YggT family protein